MRLSEIELRGEDIPGVLTDLTHVPLNESTEREETDLFIVVWSRRRAEPRPIVLLEILGNNTVKLTGKYRFRYDPGRTASTGAHHAPQGDFHLYDGDKEIAAWDTQGQARHGFQAGHRLPKRAYDAIVARHPNVNGLKGRVLECCIEAIENGEIIFELP